MVKKIVITLIVANLFFAINCMNRKFKQEKSKEHEKNVSAQKLQNILTQSYNIFNPRLQDIIIQYTGFKDDRLSDGAIPHARLRSVIDKAGIQAIAGLPARIIAQYVVSQSWNKKETFTEIPESEIYEDSNCSYGNIKLSPNGKCLAVFADPPARIEIWDFNSKQLIKTLKCPKEITALAFSPDSKYLALGFRYNEAIKIYDIEKRKYAHGFDKTYVDGSCVINDLQYSNDGKYLAFVTNYQISRLVNLKTKVPISFNEGCSSNAIALSHDNKIMITGDYKGFMKIWDLNEKCCKYKFTKAHTHAIGTEPTRCDIRISKIGYSPNGKYFASYSDDGSLNLWDSKTYKIDFFDQAVCFDFSFDSQYIAIGFKDNSIKIFNIENKYFILNLMVRDRDPMGRYLMGRYLTEDPTIDSGEDSTDAQEIDIRYPPRNIAWSPHKDIQSIIYTPNGKFLIACCNYEIIIWEIKEN